MKRQVLIAHLSEAIQSIDLNNYRNKSKSRIRNSPWVTIPDVENFDIQLGSADKLFKIIGINKKVKPQLLYEPYINKPINRYLSHQIMRLEKHLDNPRVYFSLGKILFKRSNSFRVQAINHVFTNWYKNYPLQWIININRKVSKLINKDISVMDYRRVYIEKGKDKWRPLGVPKPEWRMLLHHYSNLLTFFYQNKLRHQHGFLPKKGTLTAWKAIFERKLIEKPFIKEWDFQNYFNTIHSNRITERLLKDQVPKEIVYFLENVNRSLPHLPSEELMDESMVKESKSVRESILEGVNSETFLAPLQAFLDEHPNHRNLLDQWKKEADCESDQEFLQIQWALFDSFKPHKTPTDFNGVAQGAPTSPILANLIMDEWIALNEKKGVDIVAYADDSVSFSDQEINLDPPTSDTGIRINEEKSGYVKYAGKWIKPLKFLGMSFDGQTFRAETRKGSKLEMSVEIKAVMETIQMSEKERNYEEILDHLEERLVKRDSTTYKGWGGNWEDYFKSKIIGFVQSRLYQGEWNLNSFKQDFTLKWTKQSWVNSAWNTYLRELNVFNCGSIANYSLLEIFRWNQKFRKNREKGALSIRWVSTKDPVLFRSFKPTVPSQISLSIKEREAQWIELMRALAKSGRKVNQLCAHRNLWESSLINPVERMDGETGSELTNAQQLKVNPESPDIRRERLSPLWEGLLLYNAMLISFYLFSLYTKSLVETKTVLCLDVVKTLNEVIEDPEIVLTETLRRLEIKRSTIAIQELPGDDYSLLVVVIAVLLVTTWLYITLNWVYDPETYLVKEIDRLYGEIHKITLAKDLTITQVEEKVEWLYRNYPGDITHFANLMNHSEDFIRTCSMLEEEIAIITLLSEVL